MQHQLNVFQYTDLRTLLNDFVTLSKTRNPQWSLTVWARALGLKGSSSLSMIITGKRQPGTQITEAFIKYFNLKGRELRHFLSLVYLEKTNKKSLVSKDIREEIQTLVRYKPKIVDDVHFSLISNWYTAAIREMVHLKGFTSSLCWIKDKLRFTTSVEKLAQAVKTLLDLKLLGVNEKGDLYSSVACIDTSSNKASEAIKQYHKQVLHIAAQALEETSIEEREFSSLVFTTDTANLQKIKQAIREFKKELETKYEQNRGDTTYQFNLQFFPLTKAEL